MPKVLLKELEPYHPLFVEEPVLAEQAVIEASKQSCDWKNPIWRHEDGTIAEW